MRDFFPSSYVTDTLTF